MQNNDIVFDRYDVVLVDGYEQSIQQVERRLRLWVGEWFLNINAGIPWLTEILGKKPDETIILAVIQQAILDDPNIQSIEQLEIELDGASRTLTVTTKLILSDGTITDLIQVNI